MWEEFAVGIETNLFRQKDLEAFDADQVDLADARIPPGLPPRRQCIGEIGNDIAPVDEQKRLAIYPDVARIGEIGHQIAGETLVQEGS